MIGKQIGLYISIFLFLKFTRYSIHKRRRFGSFLHVHGPGLPQTTTTTRNSSLLSSTKSGASLRNKSKA